MPTRVRSILKCIPPGDVFFKRKNTQGKTRLFFENIFPGIQYNHSSEVYTGRSICKRYLQIYPAWRCIFQEKKIRKKKQGYFSKTFSQEANTIIPVRYIVVEASVRGIFKSIPPGAVFFKRKKYSGKKKVYFSKTFSQESNTIFPVRFILVEASVRGIFKSILPGAIFFKRKKYARKKKVIFPKHFPRNPIQ